MIRFSCPGCAAAFSVGDEKGGKAGKCPKCGAQFQIPMPDRAAPPPPTPPPTPAAFEIQCPKCSGALAVNAADLGSDVQCPYCNQIFTARKTGSPAPPPAASAKAKAGSKSSLDDVLGPVTKKKDRSDDEDERPSRRGRRMDEDEDDDRPRSRRGRTRGEDDDEDERPSRRGRPPRDDEDDEDDRPSRRRSKAKTRNKAAGGWLVAAGVVNIVYCLMVLTCGGCGLVSGTFLTGMTGAVEKAQEKERREQEQRNRQFPNRGVPPPRDAAADRQMKEELADANAVGAWIMVYSIACLVEAVLMVPTAVGCFMKKGFCRWLLLAAAAGALLLWLVWVGASFYFEEGDIKTVLMQGGVSLLFWGIYIGVCGTTLQKTWHSFD